MAINASAPTRADIGPVQDRAFVLVDIKEAGPDGETSGKAVASVQVSTAGVPVTVAGSTQFPASLGPAVSTASFSVVNSRLTSVAGGTGATSTAITSTGSVQITVPSSVQVMEFFNVSASPIWASWTSTAPSTAGNGAFPIPALATFTAGYYAAPPGGGGTLTFYSTGASAAYTCNLWS